ncbi:MAG: TetR/AcrR family transcriptional repressor of multidrug resistance operon [Thalassolituus sp.]|jgi:AcrR family transcriptional regulator
MDKREQILEATANLIAECGLQSPISLVAKQACCGAGTIYRYFDTKEELIEMVYLKQMERLSDACLANNDKTGSVREQLHNIWSNLFHYLNDSPRDAALLDQLGVAPDVREELQLKAQAGIVERIHALFDEGRARGEVKDLPNDVLGVYAYGGISTLVRMARTKPGLKDQTITEEMVLSLCWDAIANH